MRTTPCWLKKNISLNEELLETKKVLAECRVNTVCESGLCPNLNECFSAKLATFLILGNVCTRNCSFCSVAKSSPEEVDEEEALRISEAACRLGLEYVVITSVTRDDLADGGASQFVKVIEALRKRSGGIRIEVLVPDFNGSISALERVLAACPDVFGHNIETAGRLYPNIRPGADYKRSLGILKAAKLFSRRQMTKSAVMVGLGETEAEVAATILDIRGAGCDILTIGQYLRPRAANVAVDRFVSPEEFDGYRRMGEKLGFGHVAAGPFVRSSYRAGDIFNKSEGTIYDGCCAAAAG